MSICSCLSALMMFVFRVLWFEWLAIDYSLPMVGLIEIGFEHYCCLGLRMSPKEMRSIERRDRLDMSRTLVI